VSSALLLVREIVRRGRGTRCIVFPSSFFFPSRLMSRLRCTTEGSLFLFFLFLSTSTCSPLFVVISLSRVHWFSCPSSPYRRSPHYCGVQGRVFATTKVFPPPSSSFAGLSGPFARRHAFRYLFFHDLSPSRPRERRRYGVLARFPFSPAE